MLIQHAFLALVTLAVGAVPAAGEGLSQPAHGVAELRARIDRSFDRLRADAPFHGGSADSDGDWEWLTPAGDFDGDSRTDILSESYTPLINHPCLAWDRYRFELLKGTTGTPLRVVERDASVATAVPARVGANGGPGMIVLSYKLVTCRPLIDEVLVELSAAAVDAIGAEVWHRTWRGTSLVGAETEIPFPVSLLDAAPGPADELLVALKSSGTTSELGASYTDAYVVVHGANGSDVSRATITQPEVPTWLAVEGDVSGDGLDDYLVTTNWLGQKIVPRYVEARRGVDAGFMWRREGLPMDPFSDTITLPGDVSGDGHPDVMFSDEVGAFVDRDELWLQPDNRVVLFDGRDGSTIWDMAGQAALRSGDVDADGVPEMAVVSAFRTDGTMEIRYELIGGSGQPVVQVQRGRPIPDDSDIAWHSGLVPVGDVDGDGILDFDFQARLTKSFYDLDHDIVSGATGQRLYPLKGWVTALQASVDGEGADLALNGDCGRQPYRMIDGADADALWEIPSPGPCTASIMTTDLTGDGRAEILTYLEPWSSAVLDGRDGSLLWGT